MAKVRYTSVEQYLADQSDDVRVVLERVRAAIGKAVPDAVECIAYQIPAFKLNGKPLLYFAGWAKHYALYPVTEPVQSAFGPALSGYEMSKGTVRFPYGRPPPVRLIGQIAKFRAKECLASRPLPT